MKTSRGQWRNHHFHSFSPVRIQWSRLQTLVLLPWWCFMKANLRDSDIFIDDHFIWTACLKWTIWYYLRVFYLWNLESPLSEGHLLAMYVLHANPDLNVDSTYLALSKNCGYPIDRRFSRNYPVIQGVLGEPCLWTSICLDQKRGIKIAMFRNNPTCQYIETLVDLI